MVGRTNAGGGGSGLNFKVVGGTVMPSNPKTNTIWVNTAIKITSWIFSATEPSSAEEGMVWISVGAASNVAFSATKKNPIMVYPLYAKQSVSGAWVKSDAKIYQNGWNDLLTEVVFFGDGNLNTEVFGGTTVASGYNSYGISGGNMTFSQYVDVTTTKLFDVSAFNTIECVIANWDYMHVSMDLVDSSGNKNALSYITSDQTSGGLRTFDISGYSGEYYLRLYTGAGASNSVSYSSIKFKV